MVVICLPAASATGTEQERVATPSICTVQAPHCAMPQPYLVPVMPMVSRITHRSGVSASTSTVWAWPLMDSEIIQSSRSVDEAKRSGDGPRLNATYDTALTLQGHFPAANAKSQMH